MSWPVMVQILDVAGQRQVIEVQETAHYAYVTK